jgi:triacylglycerol lipase
MNIVLVHGILGFSHLGTPIRPIEYFSGIAEFLRTRFQSAVIAPAVDPTAGIETRSEMLRASIQSALTNGQLQPEQPIHIIAHSMGGLDSRRMLTKAAAFDVNGLKVAVQTLVTIGTPHRGSPVADLIALKFLDKLPFAAPVLDQSQIALNSLLSHFRISLDGLHDLTSESANQFNSANPNQPSVKYLSFAGGGRPGLVPTSAFFLPYYEFIRAHVRGQEVSDGVVAVSSAVWGDFDPNLWPGDHADEIGHNLDQALASTDPATLQRYERIISRF